MIFQSKESLENTIVLYLTDHPSKSAHEIYEYINSKEKKYSLQGVYKELKKLDTLGVIIKIEKRFSLRLPWVLELTSLADKVSEKYLNPKFSSLLPDENQKEIWHFDNLFKLNHLWTQILLTLVEQSKEKVILGWNPHTWFHLAETKEEERYIKALELSESKLYLLIGGDHYLDKWAEKYLEKSYIKYSYAKTAFQEERSRYYNVVDDYVITVKLDEGTTYAIEALYEKTLSEKDLNISEIMDIFNKKVKASIWLEKNKAKADEIKGRFEKEFVLRLRK